MVVFAIRRLLTSLLATVNVGYGCSGPTLTVSRLHHCRHSLLAASRRVLSTITMYSSTRPTTSSSGNAGGRGGQLDLSGVYPPIATPFDNNENIDYDKLRFNLQCWNDIPFKGRPTLAYMFSQFLPRDAMQARPMLSFCVCVCVSVTFVLTHSLLRLTS